MELHNASRKHTKMKMALQGPSGSGKTRSALLIAKGISPEWEYIAVIDTENRSADLYADLGNYKVLPLQPPFTPERYIEALNICIDAGMKVIIIDSISHEWDGLGGILECHASMVGNSFTNWSKLTPRHNSFINAILLADVHIICTIRVKQDYVLSEKAGKQVPEKVGLKSIQRDGIDYEFTIVFDLDNSLHAKVSKDRTEMFTHKPMFIPAVDTGVKIAAWCQKGHAFVQSSQEEVRQSILSCMTNEELLLLFNKHPDLQEILLPDFTARKQQLHTTHIIEPQKNIANGTYTG
ncbi:MAG: AAA family ATPase [Flavipsychrobacter sp.]|nr:AAA family ATPase [Flavipsychrobacter sp.]